MWLDPAPARYVSVIHVAFVISALRFAEPDVPSAPTGIGLVES